MFGKDHNALNRAYLAGLQAQSSVYGATIPVYYGRIRGNPLLIWMNNLRKGKGLISNKKGKKAKKTPNYIENVDFLIGHNPIAGVLRFWYNGLTLGLNFQKYTSLVSSNVSGSFYDYLTVPDASFYFIIGVTMNVDYNITFNDYGGQGSQTFIGTFELPLWNVNYAGP